MGNARCIFLTKNSSIRVIFRNRVNKIVSKNRVYLQKTILDTKFLQNPTRTDIFFL